MPTNNQILLSEIVTRNFADNPQYSTEDDEYKNIYIQIIGNEAKRPDLPILYNVNCSHTSPVCILPYGVTAEIDCEQKKLTILENAVC